MSDFQRLVRLARQKKVLFMLAAQKRYSSVFCELAKRISRVRIKGIAHNRVPVTSVTYETSDGYWLFAEDDLEGWIGPYGTNRWNYRSDLAGGGKLTHTGYHILDIIPWLIRHGSPRGIDNAVVYSSFWRPQDSVSALPIGRDRDGGFHKLDPNEVQLANCDQLSEVNAQVQIAFRAGARKRCQVMINFLHEGISGPHRTRGLTRAKYEHMDLHQGPVAAATYRRIAGLLPDAKLRERVGGPEHRELYYFRNTGVATEAVAVESVDIGADDDDGPAREFFKTLLDSGDPLDAHVKSPVSDHSIGIILMEAAYRSAIAETRLGHPRPIKVTFEKGAWSELNCGEV